MSEAVIMSHLVLHQYSPEERDPIPLSVYHMPICVSFSFFQQG